jgi:hypothetical protein
MPRSAPPALSLLLLAACHDYGFQEVRYQQGFVQDDLNTVADMLFVVDDSPSMAEEQELLADNFGAFVEVVEGSMADFQAGVITTDIEGENAGLLRGDLITPETDDMGGAFLEQLDVGYYGSRDEQGAAAVSLALDGRNPDFIRPGARLNVIFVSDEDDHSPETITDYIEAWVGASGSGELVVHAIVGNMPAGCASGVTAADPGERYIEMAVLTEGYRESICADDYVEILQNIGLDLSNLEDTFYLEALPQPRSLEVWVEDVLIPQREENGWHYDGGRNAIVFTGWAVPRPAMPITVYYEILSSNSQVDDTGAGGETGDTGGEEQ